MAKGQKQEELKMSSQFALTITLHPRMYAQSVLHQRSYIQGILNQLICDQQADISAIVELTQSGNIHVHAFIRVPLQGKKGVNVLINNLFRKHSDVGCICIKPISTYHGWLHYCLKDYHQTKVELDSEDPVITNNMGDFSLLDDDVQMILNGVSECDCDYKTHNEFIPK